MNPRPFDEDVVNTSSGQYSILNNIGTGRYGNIYVSAKEGNNYIEAVKCVSHDLVNPIELFITRSIDHPYITKTTNVHYTKDYVLMFQELAKEDMFFHSKKLKEMIPEQKVIKWVFMLLQSFEMLHSLSIIHGDVKSSNILLFADGTVKIADFSLSMKVSKTLKYKHTLYTVSHRPPEILEKNDWTLSADIWSLGCTIHEILYGDNIFPEQENDNVLACINSIFEYKNLKSHHSYNPKIPYRKAKRRYLSKYENIHGIMERMLSIDPKKRPTCKELLRDPVFRGLKRVEGVMRKEQIGLLRSADFDMFNAEIHQEDKPERFYDIALELFRYLQKKSHHIPQNEAISGCISLSKKILGLVSFTQSCNISTELKVAKALDYFFPFQVNI